VVLAGVRTGAVYAIGIITICALAGAGGLGNYIVRGMNRSDNVLLAVGAIPLLLLTLLVFWGLGGVAWVARRRSQVGLMLGAVLVVMLSIAGTWVIVRQFASSSRAQIAAGDPLGTEIRIGAKNFVEGEILAQICKQMLEGHTKLRCRIVPNLT